jgi:hypothetical protein
MQSLTLAITQGQPIGISSGSEEQSEQLKLFNLSDQVSGQLAR